MMYTRDLDLCEVPVAPSHYVLPDPKQEELLDQETRHVRHVEEEDVVAAPAHAPAPVPHADSPR